MEGENSTSGPQPYQPYEAEVTNSPISNTLKPFNLLFAIAVAILASIDQSHLSSYCIDLSDIIAEYQLACRSLVARVNRR